MKVSRSASDSVSLFASACDSLITFSSQPVSSLARRMFWPPRPIACESLSSDTAMSIECESSSTTIEVTSAGAMALMTNCAAFSSNGNDVDALAGDLVRDRLHARAAHADAGADRIDARIVAAHGDLGAHARHRGPPPRMLIRPWPDLGHLELEQLDQELRRGARQEQLRAARLGAHLLEVRLDAVLRAHRLARNHLLARDEALGVARRDRRTRRCGRRA